MKQKLQWLLLFSGCYCYLRFFIFSTLCIALLFSENNRQFGTYRSFCILLGLTCFSKIKFSALLYLTTLLCIAIIMYWTQYRKNDGLKCLRSRINAKVEFLNKDIVKTFSNSECYDQDSSRSQLALALADT